MSRFPLRSLKLRPARARLCLINEEKVNAKQQIVRSIKNMIQRGTMFMCLNML